MYMQGDEIWHPGCEHAKVTENIAVSYFDMLCTFVNELFPSQIEFYGLDQYLIVLQDGIVFHLISGFCL